MAAEILNKSLGPNQKKKVRTTYNKTNINPEKIGGNFEII